MIGTRANIPNDHTWILKVMRAHGFRKHTPVDQDKGACDGVAAYAQDAIMRDDVAGLKKEIDSIYEFSQTLFPNQSNESTKKFTGFCAKVEAVNRWSKHRNLFADGGRDVVERRKKLLQIVASKKTPAEMHTTDVTEIFGVYYSTDLPIVVRGLRALVEDNEKITDPVTFTLDCNQHAVMLGYIPAKKQWYFINANRLKKIEIPNDEKFVKWLHKSFNKINVLAVSMTVSTTLRKVACLQEALTALVTLPTLPEWEWLHSASVQAHRKDDNGTSCLFLAARAGDVARVQELIEEGADINEQRSKDNELALHAAALNGFAEVVRLLLNKDNAKVNARNHPQGTTPLSQAAGNGHHTVIALLTENGANPNIADNCGYTPLFAAVQEGYIAVVELLLDRGAIVDAREMKLQVTALHKSVSSGHFDIAKLLLERGANPNARTVNGFSVLHLAVKSGHANLVNLLVKAGADLASEYEALIKLAAEKKHTDVVILLKSLQSGCYNQSGQDHDRSPTSMPEGSQSANAVCRLAM